MNLEKLAGEVHDEASFIEFAKALQVDWIGSMDMENRTNDSPYNSDSKSWRNGTIGTFVEAGISWAEKSKFGNTDGLSEVSPWRKFAHFLLACKYYG